MTNRELLAKAYAAYNRRDVEGLLELLGDDVDWPDGDARLLGKAAVERYWLHQWTETRPHDDPVRVEDVSPERIVVHVSQTVADLAGGVLSRGAFRHTFDVRDGRISRLDIAAVGRG